MNKEKLGNLVNVTSGYALKSELFSQDSSLTPVIRIRDIDKGGTATYTSEKVSDEKFLVKNGDMLVSMDGEFKIAVWKGTTSYLNQRVCKIEPKDERLVKNYLYYFLPNQLKKIEDITPFVTVKHLSVKDINDISINLPDPETQRQIVAVLDKAQSIIDKSKASLQLLDQLLRDTFLDMFGDPVSNPKGWPMVRLSEVGKLERGVSKNRPRNSPELLNGPYPLVQTGDIANSGLYLKKYTTTYSELGLKQSKMWPKGTLCITIAANIGRTAILDFDACFPDSVVGFIPNKKTNTEFVHLWFSFWQKKLEDNAPQVAQKNINLEILRDLKIILPKNSLQNSYKKFIVNAELVRNKINESIKQSDSLFQSLLQKAFSEEGIEVEQKASDFEQTGQLLIWLQKQVQGLPDNTARENFLNKLERQLVSLYEKPEKTLVKETVKDLLSLSSILRQLFQDQNVSSAAVVTTRKQVDKLMPENFRKGNAQAGQFYKILYNYAGNEEKKIRKAEEAFRSDPRYRYILESKIGVTTIRGMELDLLGIIYRRYKRSEFSTGNLEELLYDEKDFFENAGLLEEFFFQILDRFVCAEFWDQPFTFFQLRETLKLLLVEPDFPSMTSYVTSRLEQEPALLRQLFYDDKIKEQSPVAYNYFSDLQQQGFTLPRRLYLKYNNLKPAEHI